MSYGTRLATAMREAGIDRAALAKHLHMSVQAVGQVLNGKTKALDAGHHTKAFLLLRCDPLWLATGVRQARAPAAVVHTGEPAAQHAYDGLPSGLTTSECDLVKAYRALPPRRQTELRDAALREATQFLADVNAHVARTGATGPAVPPERTAATLPPRPDGEQPDTVPGTID